MLANKRGDIVIEWPGAAWPDIEKTGLENHIVQTAVSLDSMPFHLLIGKKSPFAACLPEFNNIIQDMKKDGTLDRIINKYLKRHIPTATPVP